MLVLSIAVKDKSPFHCKIWASSFSWCPHLPFISMPSLIYAHQLWPLHGCTHALISRHVEAGVDLLLCVDADRGADAALAVVVAIMYSFSSKFP